MLKTWYFSNVKTLMLDTLELTIAFDLNIFVSNLEEGVYQVGE